MATFKEIKLFYEFAENVISDADYGEYIRGLEKRRGTVSNFLTSVRASSFISSAFDWVGDYKCSVGWVTIHKLWIEELKLSRGIYNGGKKPKCKSIW